MSSPAQIDINKNIKTYLYEIVLKKAISNIVMDNIWHFLYTNKTYKP